ncbi:MAG: hypothetical protein AAF676_16225, partial [Pseudomonadota bacterium]
MSPAAEVAANLAEELDAVPAPEVARMAAHIGARPGVAAVLFYGARRRASEDRGGPLDFYALTDGDAAWRGPGLSALACRLLPPNVYAVSLPGDGDAAAIDAKVAVMRLAAFRARMRPGSWDTTLWARFSQPATLVWARDAAARRAVRDAVAAAVETAAHWAAHLSPAPQDAAATWRGLHRATYAAELRVESAERVAGLFDRHEARWRKLHALLIADRASSADPGAARAFRRRARVGKLLNAARLAKAAFTYRGGAAYLRNKVARHARRAPLDGSPGPAQPSPARPA